VVLLAFLRNMRITLVISLVLPTVLLSTCLLLYVFGQSFQHHDPGRPMAAAVGLVVDDAVVMLEHIARRTDRTRARNENIEARHSCATPRKCCGRWAGSSAGDDRRVSFRWRFSVASPDRSSVRWRWNHGPDAGGVFPGFAAGGAAAGARPCCAHSDAEALEHAGPWLSRIRGGVSKRNRRHPAAAPVCC